MNWNSPLRSEDSVSGRSKPIVSGEILLEEYMHSFSKATVCVYLEDVSLMNAPSKILAEQVIPNVSHDKGIGKRLEFTLYGKILDEHASYSVRVH